MYSSFKRIRNKSYYFCWWGIPVYIYGQQLISNSATEIVMVQRFVLYKMPLRLPYFLNLFTWACRYFYSIVWFDRSPWLVHFLSSWVHYHSNCGCCIPKVGLQCHRQTRLISKGLGLNVLCMGLFWFQNCLFIV